MPIIWSLLLSGIIIMCSSFVRGTTGFGLALTAFPLLSMYLPVREAVVLVAIVNLVFSVVHILRERSSLQSRDVIIIGVFSLLGVFLGFMVLKNINENFLRLSTGVIIILSGIAIIKGLKIRIKSQSKAYGIASFLGGILAGSITIGGPVVAIILTGANTPRDKFRNLMSVFFLFSFSFSVTFYIAGKMVDKVTSLHALAVLPFLVSGLLLGEAAAKHMNQKLFRLMVLYLLLVMGSLMILKSVL